jgi:hypothetical protein
MSGWGKLSLLGIKSDGDLFATFITFKVMEIAS